MKNSVLFSFLFIFLLSCQQENSDIGMIGPLENDPVFIDLSTLINVNARKSKPQTPYKLYMAEYLTSGENDKIGRTVFFTDRGNKQLAGDFVPSIPLSLDGTTDITYYIDQRRPTRDLPVDVSTAAIRRAMGTWDEVTCSDLGLTEVPFDRRSTGFIAALFGYRGSYEYVADIVHCGWLPGSFFDLLDENGSEFILGVTFTIVFTDDDGNLIDTDNNGKYDVAWREIYFNDQFTWQDGAHYDVETIALHESGHGLSQAHFGEAFLSPGNDQLHFDPRAVMNAVYSGIQTEILMSDNAGHCSNWSSWPAQ